MKRVASLPLTVCRSTNTASERAPRVALVGARPWCGLAMLALAGCVGAAGAGSSDDGSAGREGTGGAIGSGGATGGTGGAVISGSGGGALGGSHADAGEGGGPAAGSGGRGGAGTGGRAAGGASAGAGSGGSGNGAGGSISSGGLDPCGRPLAVAGAVAVPSGYTTLVWHDEFDVDGAPSSASWGYEMGFVRNEELQWYQPQNAQVAGGLLVITAKKETKANPGYQAGSSDWKTSRASASYTSSSLSTSGKQSWQYGRFEMCAKIPTAAGMWPAWWTLGVSGEWPSNGEIDIMEFYKGKILANVACGTDTRWTAKWDSVTKSVDAAWAAKFHLWRMDWDGTKIDLYVDDTLMNSAKLTDMLNADGKSPFMQKAYMIVNLALGGTNGGDPSGTTFPQTYQIDYLRVFK